MSLATWQRCKILECLLLIIIIMLIHNVGLNLHIVAVIYYWGMHIIITVCEAHDVN